MFNLSITAFDLILCITVNDKTSSSRNDSNAYFNAAFAASVAYPLPQYFLESRQPISTHGLKGKSASGLCKPTNPINCWFDFNSTAQNPQSLYLTRDLF